MQYYNDEKLLVFLIANNCPVDMHDNVSGVFLLLKEILLKQILDNSLKVSVELFVLARRDANVVSVTRNEVWTA